MSENALYRELEELLIKPYARRQWESAAARSHWVTLEGWQDSLAGPLSAIAKNGGCSYVYERDDWWFLGVTDPPSLKLRLLQWHAGLEQGVRKFQPHSASDHADVAYMRQLVARLRVLIDTACEVESTRWQAARDA